MNNKNLHNDADALDDFFKKQLGDATLEPSAKSWEAIEEVLQQDERKKRRGIFWIMLSGLLLLIGISVSVYYFAFATISTFPQTSLNSKNNNTNNNNDSSNRITPETIDSKLNNVPSENISSTTNNTSHQIQLGAFKRSIKPGYFNEAPFPVKETRGSDGMIRYFIESSDTTNDLLALKNAGFNGVFVRRDNILNDPDNGTSIAGQSRTDVRNPLIAANNFNSQKTIKNQVTKPSLAKPTFTSQNNTNQNSDLPLNNDNPNADNINDQVSKSSNNTGNKTPSLTNNQNNVPDKKIGNNIKPNESPKTDSIAGNNLSLVNLTPTKTDNPNIVTIKDSVPEEPPARDSTDQPVKPDDIVKTANDKETQKDSSSALPFFRWAIAAYGGPNFLVANTSHLYSSANEHNTQNIFYTGSLGLDYHFSRNFSLGGSFSYQENQLQQDSTRFKFYKYINSDYEVNSSYGPMNINKDVLLKGYYLMAPIDTFAAAYEYKIKLKTIQMPIHAKWYFINGKYIQIAVNGGIIPTYTYYRKAELTLIKENSRNTFSYDNMKAKPFSMLLLMGLNADFRITKRFYFSLAPTYRLGLTNTSAQSGVKYKPSYFSGMGGIKFKF